LQGVRFFVTSKAYTSPQPLLRYVHFQQKRRAATTKKK